MIRFACPGCNKVLKAPENKVGAKSSCPYCGQRVQVPAPVVRRRTVLGRLLPHRPPVLVAKPAPPQLAPVAWKRTVDPADVALAVLEGRRQAYLRVAALFLFAAVILAAVAVVAAKLGDHKTGGVAVAHRSEPPPKNPEQRD